MASDPDPPEEQSADPREAQVHALTLRLTRERYRRLRRYVVAHEERYGRRITHQAVLLQSLLEFLDNNDDGTG